MKLKIKRPIVFFDIESTGLDTENDRIIELSMCKLHPNMEREIKTYRYNPEVQIKAEVTEIHGITNEMVKDAPLFKQHAKGIIAFLDGSDIAGYNSNRFDIPLLYAEINRAGFDWDYKKHSMVDVGNIFKIKEARTLEAAVKFYCDKEHIDAHSAEVDVLATIDVFLSQVEKYDLPEDIDELALFSNYDNQIVDLGGKFITDKDQNIILNFGKHKGELAKNHLDFINWMLTKGNFGKDTMHVASNIMQNN